MTTYTNKKYIQGFVFSSILVVVVLIFNHTASASVIGILAGRDLSTGATGADVVDLQGLLSEQGYLQIPTGVSYGYFGSLTQSALARYQAVIGVPATGYFGPMTRARITQVFTARGWMTLLMRENS